MRVSAALVAGFWAFLLLLAAALLAGMGGHGIEVGVYIGAIAVFALFAVAVTVAGRRSRLRAGTWRDAPGGGGMLLLALAVVVAGLGLAFGWWLSACAAPLFVAAAVHEVYARRKRMPTD
jgi:NADH:ubiquinone oxidoreductase subunit 6 (subunit J)